MLWRKKKADAVPPIGTPPTQPPDPELEMALEATAGVLRALGRHAFDVGETPASAIADTFERWAAHVLVLGRAPGDEVDASGGDGDGRPPRRRRDWGELARFVVGHRQKEQKHVVQTRTEMRAALLTFVRCLGRASTEQGKTSKQLRLRVARLRASVESNSLEELRTCALGVAEAVTEALEEQDRRMEEQTRELRSRLSQLQDDLDEATREGSTDVLTKLQNRRAFDAALERSVAIAAVVARPLCLVMVDVDHFKSINDRFGHPVGDRVLRTIADSLSRSFPRRGDVVARYGGEEFACLLAGTTQNDARVLTQRLMTAIRKLQIDHAGEARAVTVSAGVGVLRSGESGEELVARVDRALYDAKGGGRDRFVEADSHASGTHRLADVEARENEPTDGIVGREALG